MKKIGTLTFHRAQNYGSILQTYALQKFVCNIALEKKEEIDYKVVDIKPETQKELYSIYKKGFNVTNIIKNITAFCYYKKLKEKNVKFEKFLKENINLTDYYDNKEELINANLKMDYFITGSDQIWNVRSRDFEDYYYLDFVRDAKKISYAASFGPLKIDWSKYDADKYSKLLNEYSHISTREKGSAANVIELTGKEPEINVDPTFLLEKEEWRKVQSDVNYKNGKYILMYCLEPSKSQLKMVKLISKKLKLPVVITKYNNKNDIFNSFVKKYETGPADFLSLIDNAALVLTSSFHGTAFSLIYRKKFYVFNGKTDNRISDILDKTNLLDRSIECICDIDKVNLEKVNFEKTEEFLSEQKQKSFDYLSNALN